MTQILFTPDASQLLFTADGGLLGYGSVNSLANPMGQTGIALAWGYAGGKNYAQQTSQMQTGAYQMAGNFLLGDQTTLDNSERAAVLLFTGWGDATNAGVLERPGTTGYIDGFANYAGLNFRAPAQGRSYIANVDSGLYPFTSRAKYYVRSGGVKVASRKRPVFPPILISMAISFSFASYRLSYLDSENDLITHRRAAWLFPPNPRDLPCRFSG